MPRKLNVASGSAAIATADAVISTDSTIHSPSAVPTSGLNPNASGGTDQIVASEMPSITVSRTAASVAAPRCLAASRRKVIATEIAATTAPQQASAQSGALRWRISVTIAAPITLAASRNSANCPPAWTCAARIGAQSVVSAGSYSPSSARASICGLANWDVFSVLTHPLYRKEPYRKVRRSRLPGRGAADPRAPPAAGLTPPGRTA